MAELRIVLIIDKSEGYISFQKRRFLERWNVQPDNVTTIDSLTYPVAPTLFGDQLFYVLNLENADAVKKFNEDLKKITPDGVKQKFENGLIIVTNVARTSTSKMEKSLKDMGATVVIPPGKNDESISDKILSELYISRSLKTMLAEYVGDEYEQLLPIVEDFSSMSQSEQRNLTEEDAFIRIPQSKGSVPPWDIEKYMFAGNIQKMIQLSRRVSENSSGIIWPMSVIRGKIALGHKIAALTKQNFRITNDQIAEIIGETSAKVSMCRRYTVGNHSLEAFQKALLVIDKCERDVKGQSSAPADVVFEQALVTIAMIFKDDK